VCSCVGCTNIGSWKCANVHSMDKLTVMNEVIVCDEWAELTIMRTEVNSGKISKG
jgi:hypothetical protein